MRTRALLAGVVFLSMLAASVCPADEDLKRAEAAVEAGNLDEAEALYRKLIRAGGDYAEQLAKVRQLRFVHAARAAVKAGELDKALRAFRKALAEFPSLNVEREMFRVELRVKARGLDEDLARRSKKMANEAEAFALAGRWAEAVARFADALAYAASEQRRTMLSKRLGAARLKLLAITEKASAERDVVRARRYFTGEDWERCSSAYVRAAAIVELSDEDRKRHREARRRLAIDKMVKIPAGVVWLGSTFSSDEAPRHKRSLAAFYIDRHEVTNEQYQRFVSETGHTPPRRWKHAKPLPGEEELPVTGVSHRDATSYARWAGKRLPTEAEWVRAARGDKTWLFPWGKALRVGRCNSLDQKNRGAVPVGGFPRGVSPFGVHDMLGNALEWTASTYGPYPGVSWPGADKAALRFVLRGGAWFFPMRKLRIGVRYHDDPQARAIGYGFRCAMDVTKDE